MKLKKGRIVAFPYQKECLAKITQVRRKGIAVALYVMASGLGKTFTSAFDFRRFRRQHPGARLLFLAHQNDLLEQAKISYRQIFGNTMTYGSFNGYDKETRADVTFATFQSLQSTLFEKKRKGRRLFGKKRFDYVVVDESHHGQAPTYREVIDYFRPKFLLGMTATPDRMDMMDIRDIFCPKGHKEVFSLDLEEALTRGLLTPVDYRIMADEIVDKGEISVPPHLVSVKKLNRIFFARKRDEEIVETILNKARNIDNPRMIVFDASIKHAEEFAGMIHGAIAIHSNLPKGERDKRLALVRQGLIRTVVTVDQFNEGIDIPEANVLVFLRSTQSPRIFRQQLGRGLRKSLGKKKVLVLDFVANCERLVFLDELRQRLEKSQRAHHHSNVGGEHETFSVDWGRVLFTERAQRITELLRQVNIPLTNDRLLGYLWDFYQTNGRAPKIGDLGSKNKLPSHTMYITRFGGFPQALRLAGIPEDAYSTRLQSDDFLLKKLFAFYKKHGRAPKREDIVPENDLTSDGTYRERFGTLYGACLKAGIPKDALKDLNPVHTYSEAYLLGKFSDFYQIHGRAPRSSDLGPKNNMPSPGPYYKHFGSLSAACIKAGIPRDDSYSNKSLLEKLLTFYQTHGRVPKVDDFGSKNNMPGITTYYKHFGGLPKALRLAGIPEEALSVYSSSEEVLLNKLLVFYMTYGRAPKYSEMTKKNNMPSYHTYTSYFGSVDDACRLAGIPEEALNVYSFSNEILLDKLLTFYQTHGRVPTSDDLRPKNGMPSYSVYNDRFGGLFQAFKLAGISESMLNVSQLSVLKARKENKKRKK